MSVELTHTCPTCSGHGCSDCGMLGFLPAVSEEQRKRIWKLFIEKLRAEHPDHPWVVKHDEEHPREVAG